MESNARQWYVRCACATEPKKRPSQQHLHKNRTHWTDVFGAFVVVFLLIHSLAFRGIRLTFNRIYAAMVGCGKNS